MTPIEDKLESLDAETRRAAERLRREQVRQKSFVLTAAVVGLLVLFGFGLLMYAYTPSEVPPERIGTETMEEVSE